MSKALVIVESPAKAKTINKYLGSDYIVKSSMGHVRDLPISGSADMQVNLSPRAQQLGDKELKDYIRTIKSMGVNPEDGWKAFYQILPRKTKVVRELKNTASTASLIYLATDLDREGEAIAWHLRETIGGPEEKYKRVTFSEITRQAVQNAFAQPGALNMERVHAQQARRFLDRVVGYMVSPLLWKKVARGLSAGRVQSVAVRLIVEREREIHAFVPEEYWQIFARLMAASEFRAQVIKYRNKTFRPGSKEETDKALKVLESTEYIVKERNVKPTKQRPNPPFITTTLQRGASARLGFSVKKTMMVAQRLYEAGYITYMRTDSRQLSGAAVASCRKYIEDTFGQPYLPEKPQFYSSRKGAQEAHEAIRPTQVNRTPGLMASQLDKDQARLYDLIWRQFVACQMPPAEYDSTTITITAGEYELRATGRVIKFDGWLKVMPPDKKNEDEAELPVVKAGQTLDLIALDPSQHFTKPPPRYTEATLVRELEKRGIGRPSTYAPIISTIQERGYVQLIKKRFYALKIGDIVTDRLIEGFDDLMDYGFTAEMEQQLDEIAQGDKGWRDVLNAFYDHFLQTLRQAEHHMRPNQTVPVDITCPKCGRPMMIRTARTGVFLSCSGYELPPKERCKQTINLISGEESVKAGEEKDREVEELRAKRRCPVCSVAMDSYLVDENRRLHVCGNSPDCSGYEIEEGEFKIKGYDGPVIQCDKCGAEMQLKSGRFGKYFGCTRYPDCKNSRKLMRDGTPAPPKADPVPMPELKCKKSNAYFLLRDGASGVFLAAHTFPRSRETASPLVEDLARHRDELDEKFHYLADAPQSDPDGNKAIIRFKRKEKRQYLTSEKEGKATGWTAFYKEGKWEWQKGKPKK